MHAIRMHLKIVSADMAEVGEDDSSPKIKIGTGILRRGTRIETGEVRQQFSNFSNCSL